MTPTTISSSTRNAQTTLPVGTWQLDASHSQVEFAVKHLMISTVRGRFGTFTGTLTVPETGAPTVTAEIAASSIDTRQEQRDAHLRSADFFDVDNHPTITFVSRAIDGDVENFRVIGDLTIRGITREVALQVEALGTARDPWGNEKTAFTFEGKINRRDFGLTWNQALETGGVLVADDIKIQGELQFVRG